MNVKKPIAKLSPKEFNLGESSKPKKAKRTVKKIEFGSMVRDKVKNKSGVVINQVGRLWLVHYPNGTSTLHASKDLELND